MKLLIIKAALLFFIISIPGLQNIFAQECKSEVIIKTNSVSSVIFINDSCVDKGNAVIQLEKGKYNLRIKEDVFRWNPEVFDTILTINDCNEIKRINYSFNKIDTKIISPIFNRSFTNRSSNNSFLNSTMFKILIGTAVVIGGTSAYYKHRADENFDQYNLSGDKTYLDKTHKYDLISGIAFGALQINFGILVYYFLTE